MRLQSKLPADPTSLVLGGVSLGMVFLGCCASLLAPFVWFIALVLAIIGLVMAGKSKREYESNPEAYYHKTLSNVKNGKVLCIIAIIMSGLAFLFSIGALIFLGSNFSEEILEKYNNRNIHYEINTDSSDVDYDVVDTISIDTTSVMMEPEN